MNRLLKKFSYVMAIGMLSALITGCAKEYDKNQVVAQVNNYSVTINDFKHEAGMIIPGASKELILQDIITKELLLQEAQKMKLDKNKIFMKEIEDYWKQSLIKRLISIKGEEFLAIAKVSAAEVMAEYNRMSQASADKIRSFEQMSLQIQDRLRAKKAQVFLDSWINSLRKNADIKNYETVLHSIKLKNEKGLVGGSDGE
jgi:hypothetical protein